MNVAYEESALGHNISADPSVSPLYPVVVTRFIENTWEVGASAVENAGGHSGDATLVLPPVSLFRGERERLGSAAESVTSAIKVSGPRNLQVVQRVVLKICLNSSLLRPPITPSTSSHLPQRLARVSLQPPFASFRRPPMFSSRSLHQQGPQTDRDRKPEGKPTPIVGEKLQGARAEKIWTIPNILTASRILSCPVLGYAILHDSFYVATGLLVYAGLTDFVRV